MPKKFKYIPIQEEILKRFKQAKHLFEFQNGMDYSISEFLDILVDNIGKNLPTYFNKLKK